MTPAQLRKELGELVLHVERMDLAARAVAAGMDDVASHLQAARFHLHTAHHYAGRLLVAQLTDADRAQADEAAGRA